MKKLTPQQLIDNNKRENQIKDNLKEIINKSRYCIVISVDPFKKNEENTYSSSFNLSHLQMQEVVQNVLFSLIKKNGVDMVCKNCGKSEFIIGTK
jgi:hypothetical protein